MNSDFSYLLSLNEFSENEIPFFLGYDKDKKPVICDLSRMPHLFVCGVSGSGKTSFVQAALALIAASKTPKDTNFIIYSSNIADYKVFMNIEHLLTPVVDSAIKAAGVIQWALVETLKRYRLFSEKGVRDFASFNRISDNVLPKIVLVIDDINDVLKVSADTSSTLQELLTKGRAAGVHCIVVTSIASNKLVKTKLIPSIPSKACFSLPCVSDSKALIESSVASKLDFPGHLVFKGNGMFVETSSIPFSDDDIKSFIQEKIPLRPEVIQTKEPTKENDYDEMLPQAVEAILETRQCSVSMLQRRVKLGYSRAARIVDQMEELGIVGPYEGAKPRSVLVDRTGWLEIQARLGIASESDMGLASEMDVEEEDDW